MKKEEMIIIKETIGEIAMTSAMTREERLEVMRVSKTRIVALRGAEIISEEAKELEKELREVLGLKTPSDVRLTHGALGK